MTESTGTGLAVRLSNPSRSFLSQQAVQILKRFILINRLGPGSRLPPERQLAESLNISRTVLREALSQLIGEGLIARSSPRILCVADYDRALLAAQISPIDTNEDELQDLIELRVYVELGAVETIVRRATNDDLHRIECWVREGERQIALSEPITHVDLGFHTALLQVLNNSAINSLLPLIEETLRRNLVMVPDQLSISGVPDNTRVIAEHRRIFEAMRQRDVLAARNAMFLHLKGYLDSTRSDVVGVRNHSEVPLGSSAFIGKDPL